MQEQTNKETFKLLQLSDDSKSLSDLELPEITIQRKRKVRRKTRPRPSTTHRHVEDENSDNQCNRLIIWVAIFLISCWLLTLSYMLAVIHNESTRLDQQIKKVALTSKNVPEEMQKWHETSKSLEQNQTFLATRIVDIHAIIEDLKSRFVVYEAKLNEKKDYQKDEKTVADFGAEVKAVSADVERLRDKFVELQKGQTDFRNEINALKGNFSETIANASIRANNNETFYSDELKKAQVVIFDEIKSLRMNLTVVNDTLSQKIKGLSEDQTSMRSQIDGLQERTANITSHVVSIDLDWNQNKRIVSDFEVFKNSSNYELQSLKNITIDLKNAVESVRLDCNKVQNELSRVETQTENQNNNTAKKDPLKQILDDKIANLAPNSALNLGEKPKPTSGTNLSEATKSSTTSEKALEIMKV